MFCAEIVKNRFLGFLIWQSIHSTFIFLFCKAILLYPLTGNPLSPSLLSLVSFLTFHLTLILFCTSLFIVSSPRPDRPASFSELALGLVRFLLHSVAGGGSPELSTSRLRRRVKTSLGFLIFVMASAVSGFLAVVSVCWSSKAFDGPQLIGLGIRGFLLGFIYGVYYVYKQRWIFRFPIIQRPPFFSFKMGIPSAIQQAVKLSSLALLISSMIMLFLPDQFQSPGGMGKFIVMQIVFYYGSSAVTLCWELSHHLHQVLHTKRCIFAPPKGSAALGTNPSEPLLVALEESTPRSLVQYLAYLDLCMVFESNVDTWRRAAFFEETGETYKRVVAICLRPLEQLTSELGEGLEGYSMDKTDHISHQLRPPTDTRVESKLIEAFSDYQLYAWCARSVAALTAHSHKEDRFGVAQLSGCHAAVISTLLSCLLAVEACMGKKTNLQSPQFMGPSSIRWATLNPGKRDVATSIVAKKRGGPLHSKAYSMADILKTSVYHIVSVFHDEMMASAKTGALGKVWVASNKPLYSTREILEQKLGLFLDFRVS